MPKPGAKRLVRHMTFKEWMERPDAFATREQVTAFWNLTLKDQVLPLMVDLIRQYDERVRQDRWYRRIARAFAIIFRRRRETRREVPDVPTYLPDDDGGAESSPAPTLVPASGSAQDNGHMPQSCVVCGSRQLGPVNERGGIRCHNGHVIEDPPAGEGA